MDTSTARLTPHLGDRAATRSRPVIRDATDRLRRALRLNATTSILAGLLMTTVPERVERVLGTGYPGWVRLVGIGVVIFGIDVALLCTRPSGQLQRWTPVVIGADIAWVAASVVTILLGWYSTSGVIAVVAMAVAVDTFAVLQFRAWRQTTTR